MNNRLNNLNKFGELLKGKKIILAKGNTSSGNPLDSKDLNEKKKISFSIKPLELEKYLKNYIIGQDNAIEIISTKVCTHFNRMIYDKENPDNHLENKIGGIKNNILLIGPTGVGKTYIIRLIAKKLNVPFVKADITKYTETGYVGGDVEDLVRELIHESGQNLELAQYGIIYLDEIDKIASSKYHSNSEISRAGVQRNLLKIMEDSDVSIKSPIDMLSQMENILQLSNNSSNKEKDKKINTKNILFIMSGAFSNLEDIIKQRINKKNIGFKLKETNRKKKETKNILKYVNHEDLIEYGFETEFIGRIPIIATLNSLTKKHFYRILQNPKNNIIQNKLRDFKAYGINLKFKSNGLLEVAKQAGKSKTGARVLMNIIEKKLLLFEKILPSNKHINHVVFDAELFYNPKFHLKRMITLDAIEEFNQIQLKQANINFSFTSDAVHYIVKNMKKFSSPYSFISNALKNFNYALSLIEKSSIEITEDILENPEIYLQNITKR